MDGLVALIVWGIVGLISLGIYFLPTIVAMSNSHQSGGGIFILNLLLGWSLLGWVIALVWSFTNVEPSTTIIHHAPQQPAHQGQCLSCGSWNVARLPDGTRVCGNCGQRG